jgi:hypothetical protein
VANPNVHADEAAILERLADLLTYTRTDSISVLAGVVDLSSFCPGVYLSAGGCEITSSAQRGRLTNARVQWILTVLVVHHDGNSTLSATRAGALRAAVMDALIGWSPDSSPVGFQLDAMPEPTYAPGWAAFPLHFSRQQVFKAA